MSTSHHCLFSHRCSRTSLTLSIATVYTLIMAAQSDSSMIAITQETAKLFFCPNVSFLVFSFLVKISFVTIVNTPERRETSIFPLNYILFSLLFILASILTHSNGVIINLRLKKETKRGKVMRRVFYIKQEEMILMYMYSTAFLSLYAGFPSVYNFHRNSSPIKMIAVSV